MIADRSMKKALSLLIVLLFVMSPMAVLLRSGEAGQGPPNVIKKSPADLDITGTFVIDQNTVDPITGKKGMYGQDGNITVESGGALIIRNATLYFVQDNGNDPTDPSDDHHYWMNIKSGGNLIMENAKLTVSDSAIHPYLKLPVTIEGRAILTHSVVQFPGTLTVSNGIMYANNTVFKGLANVKTEDYNEDGKANQYDVDDNDDCPIMNFINSKVVFADSKVEDYYENTQLPSIFNDFKYNATLKSSDDTTTNQNIGNLTYSDGKTYNVSVDQTTGQGQTMNVTAFNNNTILPYHFSDYGKLIEAILEIEWDKNDTYDGDKDILLYDDKNWYDTGIKPSQKGETHSIDLMKYNINTMQEIKSLSVYFHHDGSKGTVPFDLIDIKVKPLYSFNITVNGGEFYAINTFFDLDFRDDTSTDRGLHDTLIAKNNAVIRMYNVTVNESETETTGHPSFVFEPQDTSKIYLYGWLNPLTIDGNSTDPTPVPYCGINSTYYAPSQEAKRITWENNTLHNGDPVLEYLNRTFTDRNIDENNYNTTNSSGVGKIPLLKNIISSSDLNGLFLGNYLVTAYEHVNHTNVSEQINFPSYPNITAEDNGFHANFSFSWEYPPRDLAIWPSDILIQPATIVRGDLVWVNATIHNIGGINVTKSFEVDLFVDGTVVNRTTVNQPVERNNGTVNVSMGWQTVYGDYGNHEITIAVDPNKQILDGRRGNNNATVVRFVHALYDLSVSSTDISWTPANPYTYQTVTITVTIHNTGHADITQDFVVDFSVNGTSIGTRIVTQNITAGGSTLASMQFNESAQNIYNISVAVDSTNVITEDDENNNDAYRLMTMNPTPDLVVSDIHFAYPAPYAGMGYNGTVEGTNVTITATVENIGETYANGTITVNFYDGDPNTGGVLIGSANITTNATTRLYKGDYVYLSVNWIAGSPYGNHMIYAVVNFTNNAGEAPETNTVNNENSKGITVYMRPNLKFTGEYHFYRSDGNETTSIIENNTAILEAVVENTGGYPATFDVSFYDSDQTGSGWIGNVTNVYLEPGNSTVVSIYWTPTPMAVHHITINIDPQNNVNETNETDNSMQVSLDVIGYVDLSILPSDITYTPAAPLTYDEVNITATIHNNGHRNINTSFVVDILVDGQIIGTTTINSPIPVGGTYDVTASFMRSQNGDYKVTVNVDVENAVAETNESNNIAGITVHIGPRPEFSISSVNILNPAHILSNGTGTAEVAEVVNNHDAIIAAEIRNKGIAAAGTVTVSFYDGDPNAGGTLIDTVSYTDPGGKEWGPRATVTWHATGVGNHTIYVRVSASTSPPEGNRDDNTANLTVKVLLRPDLAITNMTFLRDGKPINTTAGISECEVFEINATIVNSGGNLSYSGITEVSVSFFKAPFNGNWSVLLGNISIDNQSLLNELSAGNPVNVSIVVSDYPLSPGTANIYAIVDPMNLIDESNEDNNSFNRTLTVRQANLNLSIQQPNTTTISIEQGNIVVQGQITEDGESVGNIRLKIELVNSEGIAYPTVETTTNSDRNFNFIATLSPLPQNPGEYRLRITAYKPNGTQLTSFPPTSLSLERASQNVAFPFWMMLLLVIIIVAAIIGVSLMAMRRYALAKYVECGNCGRMIPAGSEKCPYCGAEFDKEMVKCSVCGAWIPADAKECPNCGAKFLVTGKEIIDYESQMRNQYEEFVERFRRQAKKELGKEFTEEKFQQWWKSQKSYVTFEDWLKREEERKKTGGIICPVCGALNSKTDIVCHVCGSPLRPVKKKTETEGVEEAAISKIELPSLEEETEEEGEALGKAEEEKPKEEVKMPPAEEEEKTEEKPAEEVKMPLAEEKKPVIKKKVVRKVVKKVAVPPKEGAPPEAKKTSEGEKQEAKAPELPPELIKDMRQKPETKAERTEIKPEAPKAEKPEEGPKPVVKKKVVRKVVKKKVVKK